MKTNFFKTALLLMSFGIVVITSCKKNDEDTTAIQTTTIVSSMNNDGYIENTATKTVYTADSRLKIGWDGTLATRSFLSFSIAALLPTSPDKKMVIDKAVLKVYEQNTNLFPFTQGANRVVNTYLVNYGTLDARDYDGEILADCGVIASTPTSVLTEHPLDVSIPVARYITSNASVPDLQFRLEFTHGDDIATLANLLYNAMWCIYSGENQEALLNSYRPVLVLTYHYESNK
jgi:hypothetical protein